MFRHLIAILALMVCSVAAAVPVGSQFSYQGRLMDGNTPANGLYDFEFRLFDDPFGGNAVGSILQLADIPVENGVFSVDLNFGTAPFAGQARWLAIGVREGTSTGAYDPLTPRQNLTVTPYALHALSGTPGPQGPQGPSGVVQVVSRVGGINNIQADPSGTGPWVFTGGFATLTLQAGQTVTGSGVVSLGHGSNNGVGVDSCLCFSADAAGAAVTPFTDFFVFSVVPAQPTRIAIPVVGSRVFPAAGTYRLGTCARNRGVVTTLSANDSSNVWFMVTN